MISTNYDNSSKTFARDIILENIPATHMKRSLNPIASYSFLNIHIYDYFSFKMENPIKNVFKNLRSENEVHQKWDEDGGRGEKVGMGDEE